MNTLKMKDGMVDKMLMRNMVEMVDMMELMDKTVIMDKMVARDKIVLIIIIMHVIMCIDTQNIIYSKMLVQICTRLIV